MAESEPHAYARACRNTQHPGCTCMHPVDGRWCGRPRNDPIHQPRPAAMQDEDDLRGMPYEVIAVLRNAEQAERAIRSALEDLECRDEISALDTLRLAAEGRGRADGGERAILEIGAVLRSREGGGVGE